MDQGRTLTRSDQQITHVYFPTTMLVALLVALEDGETVEFGLIGREGMVNLPVFWGAETMGYGAMVLQSGTTLRMRADVFRHEARNTDSLLKSLFLFTDFTFTCAAQRAACNCRHSTTERVASWLLVMCDYLGFKKLVVTHELIAEMLGVRRASVTQALNEFKHHGMLISGRGHIEIIGPEKLASLACECSQVIKKALDQFRMIGRNMRPRFYLP
jgi:CRP-like cAMP-binding protein